MTLTIVRFLLIYARGNFHLWCYITMFAQLKWAAVVTFFIVNANTLVIKVTRDLGWAQMVVIIENL